MIKTRITFEDEQIIFENPDMEGKIITSELVGYSIAKILYETAKEIYKDEVGKEERIIEVLHQFL